MKNLRTLLFGISPDEATFERRGFPACGEQQRLRLEQVGRTFLVGYHAALEAGSEQELVEKLEQVDLELRGFAYEGSAMALGLLDMLFPWKRNRWRSFTDGAASHHVYMMYVGLGWAMARMRRRVEGYISKLDPLLGWLALDGYGFHEGYFHWESTIRDHNVPARLTGYALRGFDQGLGRSMWFVLGSDVLRIATTIESFHERRHSDLWSGVGLAATYAGGVDADTLRTLVELSGRHYPAMAQGSAFATEARRRAGNVTEHTVLACRTITGLPVDRAGGITSFESDGLPYDAPQPAFEIWRRRIQSHFTPRSIGSSNSTPVVDSSTVITMQGAHSK
jgi:hypothetical protein